MLIERTVYLTNRQEVNFLYDRLLNAGYSSHEGYLVVNSYGSSKILWIRRNNQYQAVFPFTIKIEIPDSRHETVVDLLLAEFAC